MASKPGGYSGGDRGPMGSHTGMNSASGTGFGGGGGFSKGMQGATARRTAYSSPSYPATLENLGKLFSRSIPGPGMIMGAGLDITGARPGYSGYTGHVNTPGSYDNKGMEMSGGGYPGMDLATQRALLTRGYGAQHMFMPQQAMAPKPQVAAPAAMAPKQMFAPATTLSTGGKYGISQFRPGYGFLGPGGM